jgi:hypothetical protein
MWYNKLINSWWETSVISAVDVLFSMWNLLMFTIWSYLAEKVLKLKPTMYIISGNFMMDEQNMVLQSSNSTKKQPIL